MCAAGKGSEVGRTHGEKHPLPVLVLPAGWEGPQDDTGHRTRWLWRVWASRWVLPNKIPLTETSSHRPLETNTLNTTRRTGTEARTQALCFLSLCPTGLCLQRTAELGRGTVAQGSLPLRQEDMSPTHTPQSRAFPQSPCPGQWGTWLVCPGPLLSCRPFSIRTGNTNRLGSK